MTDQAMTKQLSDAERKRWYSTGYLANGVGSVDADKHTLHDAAVIRVGEALGHRMWIDADFCNQVVDAGNALADKGLKARFGHPDMCSDALGTFLGRWKGLATGQDGIARGSLHLSSTAAESPRGDLRNYIESMAAKEPEHFGTSIVFSRDWDAEDEFIELNTVEKDETDGTGNPTGNKVRTFQSPDPANVKNLRHARLSSLHAADLVDDPAATDGMFSGVGGTELAARVSEWLDTHPEVLSAFGSEPEMIEIVERYATELRPFIARYNANHPEALAESTATDQLTEQANAEPSDGSQLEGAETGAAESTAVVDAEHVSADALRARLTAVEADSAQVMQRAESAEASLAAVTSERDQSIAELKATADKLNEVNAEVEKLRAKLAAIEKGASPVSAKPAAEGDKLSPWQKAQKR